MHMLLRIGGSEETVSFKTLENWKMNSENDDIAINTVNLVICWVNGLACGGNIERLVAHIV